jgi:hypothetical protein
MMIWNQLDLLIGTIAVWLGWVLYSILGLRRLLIGTDFLETPKK